MTRKIGVLRLSHRIFRDQRITTHVALISRAFGCTSFFYTGDRDEKLTSSLEKVNKQFGGNFSGYYHEKAKECINSWNGIAIHLSMYGEPHNKILPIVKNCPEDILLIVGGSKVPRKIFELADYNVAIGHQPHSEISAVAIFLTDFFTSTPLYNEFPHSKIKAKPGKKAYLSKTYQK